MATLPQMCAKLRDELDFGDDVKALSVVNLACEKVGVDKSGTLIERARACLEALGVSEDDAAAAARSDAIEASADGAFDMSAAPSPAAAAPAADDDDDDDDDRPMIDDVAEASSSSSSVNLGEAGEALKAALAGCAAEFKRDSFFADMAGPLDNALRKLESAATVEAADASASAAARKTLRDGAKAHLEVGGGSADRSNDGRCGAVRKRRRPSRPGARRASGVWMDAARSGRVATLNPKSATPLACPPPPTPRRSATNLAAYDRLTTTPRPRVKCVTVGPSTVGPSTVVVDRRRRPGARCPARALREARQLRGGGGRRAHRALRAAATAGGRRRRGGGRRGRRRARERGGARRGGGAPQGVTEPTAPRRAAPLVVELAGRVTRRVERPPSSRERDPERARRNDERPSRTPRARGTTAAVCPVRASRWWCCGRAGAHRDAREWDVMSWVERRRVVGAARHPSRRAAARSSAMSARARLTPPPARRPPTQASGRQLEHAKDRADVASAYGWGGKDAKLNNDLPLSQAGGGSYSQLRRESSPPPPRRRRSSSVPIFSAALRVVSTPLSPSSSLE